MITSAHHYSIDLSIPLQNNIIVIRPKTIFEKNDTLRFEGEFCKKIFNEGYEIAKNMNISM